MSLVGIKSTPGRKWVRQAEIDAGEAAGAPISARMVAAAIGPTPGMSYATELDGEIVAANDRPDYVTTTADWAIMLCRNRNGASYGR